MPDYAKGKIYMVCSNDGDMEKVYYGSTTQSLSCRMAQHRRSSSTVAHVFDKYGTANCHIELIELCPCNSREELERTEKQFIRQNVCVNQRLKFEVDKLAYNKEYSKTHKEQIRKQKQDFRANNPERYATYARNKKVECPCGSIYTKSDQSSHLKTKRHQTYLTTI